MSEKLSNGNTMPTVGLGTWQSQPGEVGAAVEVALKNGYRHIDCAWIYGNQKEIGEVFHRLFNGQIKREDIFITSKVWNTFHSYDLARKNISDTLADLKLDYIDLILIHWPMGYEEGGPALPLNDDGTMRYSNIDYTETWKALEDAYKEGKVKNIGISNFNHKQILRILEVATVKPTVLQTELHPYLQEKKLREFCKEHDIAVVAYSSLGNPGSSLFRTEGDPNILTDPAVFEISQRTGKTPAQVALRWAVQSGIRVIPKSTKEERIRQNADILSWSLSDADMKTIEGLDRGWRFIKIGKRDGVHPHFPFTEKY